jgi:GH15 family glucan-1,4-alpha-glucosidase
LTFGKEEFLVRRSVEAILRNQGPNGSIIASRDFDQYRFCWLRDGSFSAYALDIVGEYGASNRYHAWVNRAVQGIAEVIDDVIKAKQRGVNLDPLDMPPARFALDGSTVVDDWPNFQIDGYGTWLWSLGRHLELSGYERVPNEFLDSIERVARYLETFSQGTCYDVWEENGDAQHTSTLACVYGGLKAAALLLTESKYEDTAAQVQERLSEYASQTGYFVKSSNNSDVDASSLWLSTPFDAVKSTDEYFSKTVALIEDRLTLHGGLRRYPTDVYFGSGAWPVLTASLGWHYAAIGDFESAERCRQWIFARFDRDGCLGEQYGGDERDFQHYQEWVARWGPPAQELTWSHAMYVVLCAAIGVSNESDEELTQLRQTESQRGTKEKS